MNESDKGSPAHAGIGPQRQWANLERLGFPRACGDRPAYYSSGKSAVMVPPRMRG